MGDNSAMTLPAAALAWHQGFASLGPAFYTELRPTPLPEHPWRPHPRPVALRRTLPAPPRRMRSRSSPPFR